MKTTLHVHVMSLTLVGAFLAAPVLAVHPPADPFYGSPAHAGTADRTIVLGEDRKSVGVTGGETVRFVVNGESFLWRFDTFDISPVFDLREIAPAGMLDDREVRVYVDPDPAYLSG